MSESVVEDLILAVQAIGVPEATAAVDSLTVATDRLAVATERADVAATGAKGGATRGAKGGLLGGLSSMKALVAGLGIYEGIKAFSSFQSQMERLRTQTGATQLEVGQMSKGILSMAVSVGTGPNSLAQALYHIESAGFRGQEALDALRVASQGAKIGGANLTDTTTAMTAVMVAGFRGTKTLREAMGQLNATVGAGDMTMQDLNEAMGTGILGTLKQLGLQVKDTGAALAVLGDNNIRGAQAATRLRMGLMQLVHPSSTAAKAMKELGMGPMQLAEDMRKPNGLLRMLEDLKGHLKGLSPTQQTFDLASIFGGGRNSAAMLILINQMDRLKTKYAEVAKGGKDFGADWKATTHTLSFFVDQVKALAEVALIKLGTGLAWVIDRIKGFVSALEHGKTAAVFVTAVFGTLAAGLALMALTIIPGLIVSFGALTLSLMANPLTWVVLGIAALVTLMIKSKAARQVVVDAFHWIKTAGMDAFGWIKDHWKLLAAILLGPIVVPVLLIVAHFHKIVDVVKWVIGAVKGMAVAIVHAVSWMVDQVAHLIGKILGPLKSVAHFAGGLIGGAGHILGDVGGFLGVKAMGGPVSASGSYLVGERGPELVHLPGGSNVTPNHELGSALADALAPLANMGSGRDINITLEVDRKVLSRAVVKSGLEAQSCR